MQLKEQKRKGKTGPLKLHKVTSKPASHPESDDDDDKKFSNITAQLAWERDIDLTKGQAFLKDPGVVEKPPGSPKPSIDISVNKPAPKPSIDISVDKPNRDTRDSTDSPGKKTVIETQAPTIPNGNATRTIKKYVKKPNGTPKASPKVQKQFPITRVTPLPLYIKETDDTNFEDTLEDIKQGSFEEQGEYQSVLRSSQLSEARISQITVRADEVLRDLSHDFRSTSRPGSADSRTKYDQWVDELIDTSPGTSPGKHGIDSPESKKSKDKTHKKGKREKRVKKDGKNTNSVTEFKSESKSKGDKMPTSDDVLLVDDDIDDSVV